MAELIKLKAELREETGKGAAKRMRRSSKIPGIFYKGGEDAIWLQFHNKDVDNVLAKKPRLFSVAWGEGEDESQECMFREIQRHPVSQKPVHLDLMGITRGVKIETTVPVTLVGSPEGVLVGGILQQTLTDVEIRCLPSEIPDEIVVDVSHVGIQESIHLNELSFEGIEWVTSTERTVAVVQPPRVVEEDIEEEEELLEGEEGEGVEGEEEAASEEGGE